jgi:uncharacterized protein (TIGR02118 family)|tara:strand:- start:14713 stop:15072 length:360 start_codon:yes stop_codon:yes gene_type:complete
MYKSMALLKCKPGLTREQFIDYYETQHAPLICQLLPEVCGYRRNFIRSEGAFLNPGAAARDYDVITELWFADRAAYDAAMERCADPEIARRIAEDEEHFLDRSCTRMFVVDEHISAIAH